MRLFFDKNMIKQDSDNKMFLYYSSYIHDIIRVDEESAKIIDEIIEIGSGEIIDYYSIAKKYSIEEDVILEFIDSLIETKLFFKNIIDYRQNEFEYEKSKYIKFGIHTAYLHLTYRCNLNCEYCYNKDKLNKPDVLDYEQWINIINKLKNRGTKNIILTGGEPTLHSRFIDIVNYCYDIGLNVNVLTNGTLLYRLDKSVVNKIAQFIISLDNLENGTNHRVNAEKYTILDNIIKMKEIGANLIVRSVLTSQNVEEVEKLNTFLKKEGLRHIKAFFIPDKVEDMHLVPDFEKVESSIEDYDLNQPGGCGASYAVIAVSPKGDIYPCQSLMTTDFYLANILEEDWYESIKNSKVTEYFMHRKVSAIEGCESCGYRTLCDGGCRSIAYHLYQNIEHKIDYLCDYFVNKSIKEIEAIQFD